MQVFFREKCGFLRFFCNLSLNTAKYSGFGNLISRGKVLSYVYSLILRVIDFTLQLFLCFPLL